MADDDHGRYPRGVTMRPFTNREVDEPITTQVVIPTTAASSSSRVVMTSRWSGRPASVTMPTGVVVDRCSRSSSTARESCQ